MLYTGNLHSAVCQLYPNKTGILKIEEREVKLIMLIALGVRSEGRGTGFERDVSLFSNVLLGGV